MQNFLAVGDEPVELFFDNKGGITLIRGNNQDVAGKSSNGSGKSTIIEAIFFGLTGSTLRKLTGPGIIHNAATNECRVEIEYENAKIIRTLKRQAKTVKSSVEFYVDGVKKSVPSVPETNRMIDEHRGVNFETLSNILIFGQHNIISFLDAGEGEKREIIENLMNLREYNQYEQSAREQSKEAKSKLKTLAEKYGLHSSYLDEQKSVLAKQEGLLNDYRRSLTRDISVLEANIASMPDIEQLKDMWRQHNEYLAAKSNLEKRIAELIVERNQHQSEYNNAVAAKQHESQKKQPLIEKLSSTKGMSNLIEERKRLLWQELVHPLEAEIAKDQQEMADAASAAEKAIADIKPSENWDMQIGGIEKLIKQQSDRIKEIAHKGLKDNDTCPTCYGLVDSKNAGSVIGAIEAERAALQLKYDDLVARKLADVKRVQKEKSAIQAQIDNSEECTHSEINSLIKKLDTAKESVKTKYFEAKTKLDELIATAQRDVDNFDADLNGRHDPIINAKDSLVTHAVGQIATAQNAMKRLIPVEQPKTAIEEIGKLQAQLDADKKLKAEKEHLLNNNPYMEMIATVQSSIAKIEGDAAAVDKEIKEVEAKVPYYEFWVGHMGKEGIKSFVIDQIIPTLNEQIDYWMQLIYQGTITVKFDKYFNVSMVNNASKNEMIFGQGSGGERRRIDIAIMLAFRQIMKMSSGKDPSLLFFDEVAENLDEEGVYRLYDAMQDIAKTSHLYVITHNPTLLALLANASVITVAKNNGAMKLL